MTTCRRHNIAHEASVDCPACAEIETPEYQKWLEGDDLSTAPVQSDRENLHSDDGV